MSYTKEQRAANAAKAAQEAATKASSAPAAPDAAAVEPSGVVPAAAPRPESRNKPRDDAMAEIEARELRVREEEAKLPQPQREEPATEVEPAAAPVAATAPLDKAAPDAAEPVATPAVEMVHVKVDGEEFDVPKADVDAAGGISAYQRDRASDNRLKKANETLAQTRQLQANIAQQIQNLAPKAPTITDAEFIKSQVDIIRFGTEDESAAALQKVLDRTKIDENALIQKATMQMNQKAAIDNFGKEFHDVVSQPLLLKLATALEAERIGKLAPNANLGEFYRKIGNEVRSVAGARPSQSAPVTAPPAAATPTADTTSPASEKEARKASIVNLPTAAARAALPAESKPETREDVLNQMRQSRGIPTG